MLPLRKDLVPGRVHDPIITCRGWAIFKVNFGERDHLRILIAVLGCQFVMGEMPIQSDRPVVNSQP